MRNMFIITLILIIFMELQMFFYELLVLNLITPLIGDWHGI